MASPQIVQSGLHIDDGRPLVEASGEGEESRFGLSAKSGILEGIPALL